MMTNRNVWNRLFLFQFSILKNSDSVRNEIGSVLKDAVLFGYYSYFLITTYAIAEQLIYSKFFLYPVLVFKVLRLSLKPG